MRIKHLILIILVPLSEIKALFYNSNEKVIFSLYTQEEKYLCNVLEDYSNVVFFGFVCFYLVFLKQDMISRKMFLFLFILNILDFFHYGLMDLPILVLPKIGLTFIIWKLWLKLKPLSAF